MISQQQDATIGDVFFEVANKYPNRPFLIAPANAERDYDPQGKLLTYHQASKEVRALIDRYKTAGYGVGHRVALLLENRLEHFLHKISLNALGICCVPVNPDYKPRELAYLIEHSQVDLVVLLSKRVAQWEAGCSESKRRPQVVVFEDFELNLPTASKPATDYALHSQTAASILYTSGTTGRPKGCVLSHRYEIAAGEAYVNRGGMASFRESGERLYNPLPLFHVNASILSFYAVLLTGSCQVQTDRFQASRWWEEVCETQSTIVHYLGVIIQMLHLQPIQVHEQNHCVRFGMGAGVEPHLHALAESRFGFPLLELWGMTENVRILVDNQSPRQVGTRAFGRTYPGLEVRVVNDLDIDVQDGQPGEMIIRHSEGCPRRDFFSGYLDDDDATELAWRGGWFHTGDVVIRDDTGMLHFVERRKNIIRRAGENIAAAEVEAWILAHPAVAQVAVIAVADEIREEEVLACIVLKADQVGSKGAEASEFTVRSIFDHCTSGMAYFKAPGWIWFTNSIPTTGTQKIQKHTIFGPGIDPRTLPGMRDIREWKKRDFVKK